MTASEQEFFMKGMRKLLFLQLFSKLEMILKKLKPTGQGPDHCFPGALRANALGNLSPL